MVASDHFMVDLVHMIIWGSVQLRKLACYQKVVGSNPVAGRMLSLLGSPSDGLSRSCLRGTGGPCFVEGALLEMRESAK